ncbi:MAG TPA: ATP-dependent RNA helicase RhlB [Hyphomicrobiales bacterium]|nr:ATP-dependent RNA helicase RhlB [Hyphomicrobiales bacterium]
MPEEETSETTDNAPHSELRTNVRFHDFDLPPELLRATDELGFEFCTPIQAQSLRITLQGHDITGKAQTGTGKTAAFLTTIITDLLKHPLDEERYTGEPRALIIAPTRELVMQIAKDALAMAKYTGLRIVTLVGGIDYQKQLQALERDVVDIVVATPGRLLDFVGNRQVWLGMVELLVIDEADRMLDMGFIPQVRQIIAQTPRKECRQTMLFSATFTDDILTLAERWAMDPVRVEVASLHQTTDNVKQLVYLVTTDQKYPLLYNLIQSGEGERVIVFTNRRDQARRLADHLWRNGVSVGLLSGEISQPKRVRTLEEFRNSDIQVLVATDVAGRGLHIDDITHVVNFTLPEEAEDYVHRIGRTGRAGASGTSISFACEDDSFLLPGIEAKIGMKLPCEYPAEESLREPPAFTRASHFKNEGESHGKSGGNRRGGGSRGGDRGRRR